MVEIRDEFLSEQAQASNDLDRYTYSHGVFMTMTEPHETEEGEK